MAESEEYQGVGQLRCEEVRTPPRVMEPHVNRSELSLIALRRILRATELFGREFSKQAGVTAVQFRVLQTIADRGHCTAKDISLALRVSQATVTSLVDKLVRRELAVREKSLHDKRRTNIRLTEKGAQVVLDAPDPLQQTFVAKFRLLEDWEQAMLVAALERVASLLDAETLDAAPLLDTGDIQKSP